MVMGWRWLRVAGGLPAAHLFALGLRALKAKSLWWACASSCRRTLLGQLMGGLVGGRPLCLSSGRGVGHAGVRASHPTSNRPETAHHSKSNTSSGGNSPSALISPLHTLGSAHAAHGGSPWRGRKLLGRPMY